MKITKMVTLKIVKIVPSRVWWYIPLISALGRQLGLHSEFQNNQSYTERPPPFLNLFILFT